MPTTSTDRTHPEEWLSTYEALTLERLLEHYRFPLHKAALLVLWSNKSGLIYPLLQVPLAFVFNGIVMQQGKDYAAYLQKLYIDYLISGQSALEPQSQASNSKEDLETLRQEHLALQTDFDAFCTKHLTQVAAAQTFIRGAFSRWLEQVRARWQELYDLKGLITRCSWADFESHMRNACPYFDLSANAFSQDFSDPRLEEWGIHAEELHATMLRFSEIDGSIEPKREEFYAMGQEMRQQFLAYRQQFHDAIVSVQLLLSQIPGYHPDKNQWEINKEQLLFTPLADEANHA